MRPLAVVVLDEDPEDALEITAVDGHQPVKTLRANSAHEPLGDRVRLWQADESNSTWMNSSLGLPVAHQGNAPSRAHHLEVAGSPRLPANPLASRCRASAPRCL